MRIPSVFRRVKRRLREGKEDHDFGEIKVSTEKIQRDMEILKPEFDLRDDKWRSDPKAFTDKFFDSKAKHTTDDIRVPEKFKDWIIGQDAALKKIDLSEIEWIRTLKQLQEMEKKEAAGVKLSAVLRERPTNNILMLGEPGTGKSLIIKVMAESLKDKYKEEGIELEDVMLGEDRINRYKANVRYIKPAGTAKKVVEYAEIKETQKGRKKNALLYGGIGTIIFIGVMLISLGLRKMLLNMLGGMDFESALLNSASVYFGLGMTMIGFPMFIMIMFWQQRWMFGQQGNEQKHIPNLLVDNDPESTQMYVNCTLVSDAALFGSIEWSPWQTGAMAKPPYRRVQAGKIHEANKKILYIDEIRNLSQSSAIKLLTAMEDGEFPIQQQADNTSTSGGGGTAGQNIQTPPVKAMFFLFAAGNLDVLDDPHSIINQFPALRDRFENYGDIIALKDEVEATPLNEMLVAQVVRDELYRFGFPPMEAAGVKRILEYVKQRASDKDHIKLMFRAVIKVLKRSSQLSWKDGDVIVRDSHVKDAIEHYTETIEKQVIEHRLEKKEAISLVENVGTKVGQVNGLAVVAAPHGGEGAGDVMQVQSFLRFVDSHDYANFEVTGVVRGDETDVQDSKREVRTAILRIYGVDIGKDCYVHIKFSQTKVDGPSAGITMTVSLMSWLGDPREFKKRWKAHLASGKLKSEFELIPVPLRQDIAMTGAMELKEERAGDIKISAIGGVYEKIRGAKRYGLKYVLIPKENYDGKIISNDQFEGIKVVSSDTVLSYWEQVRGDSEEDEIWNKVKKK